MTNLVILCCFFFNFATAIIILQLKIGLKLSRHIAGQASLPTGSPSGHKVSGAPNENIVQNHLNIALLRVL